MHFCALGSFRSVDIKGEVGDRRWGVYGQYVQQSNDKALVFSHQENHCWGLERVNAKNKMWDDSPDAWSVKKMEQTNTDSDIQQSATLTGGDC